MTEDRLYRIENKLDRLSEAVLTIARVEEKVVSSNQRIHKLEEKVDDQQELLNELTSKVALNAKQLSGFERGLWVIFAAVASTFTYYIKMGIL